MKVIKEKSSYESITGEYSPQEPTKTVVQQMEREWPEMTKELKGYNENNMNCSYTNNTIMVLAIYRLVHH